METPAAIFNEVLTSHVGQFRLQSCDVSNIDIEERAELRYRATDARYGHVSKATTAVYCRKRHNTSHKQLKRNNKFQNGPRI